jgi:hypothetical protein
MAGIVFTNSIFGKTTKKIVQNTGFEMLAPLASLSTNFGDGPKQLTICSETKVVSNGS